MCNINTFNFFCVMIDLLHKYLQKDSSDGKNEMLFQGNKLQNACIKII